MRPPPITPCIEWAGCKDRDGYGWRAVGGRTLRAHRVAWEKANGQIPVGLIVCHACDNPSCVNPDHLWLGTHADNAADRNRKGRQSRGAKHAATFSASEKFKSARIRGSAHANAKLTEEQVREIKADGRLHRQIAVSHSISKALVSLIKRGIAWSHVQ